MNNIELKKMKNGITLITEVIPSMETFSLGFYVKTGAINERKDESGISHFIEHLLFKGTKQRSAKEISEFVDFEGGMINAFTSRDTTCYYIKLMASKIDIGIDILTDMFLNSTFDKENIEKERNVIIEEIRMYEDIPEEIVHEKNIEFALSGIHSNSISGSVESLKKIDRDLILNYLNEQYTPDNLVIVAVGAFDKDYLFNQLKEKLKNLVKKKSVRTLDLSYKINSGENIIKKDSNQVHLCFTTRGIAYRDPLRYSVAIISNILGEGMSSRLFQKIREERGLAYSVYSYLTRFENCGLLSVYVGTTKEDYRTVIELIKEELESIKQNGISERELKKAKNKYESAITFSLESMGSRMNRLASSYLNYGKIISLEELRKEIEAVSLEDIKKAAQFIFDEGFYSQTIVGNI
ncbi:MAG: pitrilysin family protein [Fusobacterium sp.]|uniref:M16 family metallopeptidase n=1 Tax=Fusobacterium sp. TaxID=68766 RepID=UPI0026DDA03F|nr:pitrilysin family protein [Fusobacterium sp.]MDO4690698.1 pitrilysin family protein [Fusobacterium sp.]